MSTAITELVIHDKKVLTPISTELYSCWVENPQIKIIETRPRFTWKGAKIPFDLWAQVVSFMRWSQKTFDEEAMLLFFYHLEEKRWAAWVFPQEPRGMTVKLLADMPEYEEDRKRFGKGWLQAGTVHHHCKGGAFASSVDKSDEEDRDGVHVTLGKMDEKTLDLHIRQTFDGVTTECSILDWVEVPSFLKDVPEYMRYDFALFAMKRIETECHPKEWEDKIYDTTPYNHHVPFHYGQARQGAGRKKHTTLLTQAPVSSPAPTTGTASPGASPSTSRNTRGQRKAQRHFSTMGEGWANKQMAVVKEIAQNLSLTPEEAFVLVSDFPDASWTPEDKALRDSLIADCMKAGLPRLHVEMLLDHHMKLS